MLGGERAWGKLCTPRWGLLLDGPVHPLLVGSRWEDTSLRCSPVVPCAGCSKQPRVPVLVLSRQRVVAGAGLSAPVPRLPMGGRVCTGCANRRRWQLEVPAPQSEPQPDSPTLACQCFLSVCFALSLFFSPQWVGLEGSWFIVALLLCMEEQMSSWLRDTVVSSDLCDLCVQVLCSRVSVFLFFFNLFQFR